MSFARIVTPFGTLRSTVSMVRSDVVSTIGEGGCTPTLRKIVLKVRRIGVFGGGKIQSSLANRAQSNGPRESRARLRAGTSRQGSCS